MKFADPVQHLRWPYPRWIAHRGAGMLAPENTLAAFRTGAGMGYRMFECDVRLSDDGLPFLLHDDTLTRTTNAAAVLGEGLSDAATDHPWSTLALLDAGSWHSRQFTGEPLASLEAIARFCLQNHFALNIEIKPNPGEDILTGETVARHATRLWHGDNLPPLLSSFSVQALNAVKRTQADLPRALLVDFAAKDWLEQAQNLQCVAVILEHTHCREETITAIQSCGMRALCYTVNDFARAQSLIEWGVDGLITDRLDVFSPAT